MLPELRVRVVNVVDLMRLQSESEHPHGLPDAEFDTIFTPERPVIFAYHGYPSLIHRLTYRRTNHSNFHVRGYKEEGTTTTPFDMVMLNDMDRFHLVIDVLDRVPGLGDARRTFASRWSTRGSTPADTAASTARIPPGSRTGAGSPDVATVPPRRGLSTVSSGVRRVRAALDATVSSRRHLHAIRPFAHPDGASRQGARCRVFASVWWNGSSISTILRIVSSS